MATITEDYCSFELSKLLKEKGFDEPCYQYYMVTKTLHVTFHKRVHVEEEPFFNNDGKNGIYEESDKTLFDDVCSAPSLSLACKWLREVHNIMVSPYALSLGYYFEIFDLTNRDITGCKPLYKVGIPRKEDVLSTYEGACEAAIKYCLENLI